MYERARLHDSRAPGLGDLGQNVRVKEGPAHPLPPRHAAWKSDDSPGRPPSWHRRPRGHRRRARSGRVLPRLPRQALARGSIRELMDHTLDEPEPLLDRQALDGLEKFARRWSPGGPPVRANHGQAYPVRGRTGFPSPRAGRLPPGPARRRPSPRPRPRSRRRGLPASCTAAAPPPLARLRARPLADRESPGTPRPPSPRGACPLRKCFTPLRTSSWLASPTSRVARALRVGLHLAPVREQASPRALQHGGHLLTSRSADAEHVVIRDRRHAKPGASRVSERPTRSASSGDPSRCGAGCARRTSSP